LKPYIILSVLIVFLSTASVLAAVPSVDDFSLENPFWNGFSTLRYRYGFQYASLSDLKRLPSNSILFVVPSKPLEPLQAEALEAFVEEGGFLVLLDEYGYSNTLLNRFGLNVSSYVLCDPLYKWRVSQLPYAWVGFEGGRFKVLLNYASTLSPGEAKVLGSSSYFSFLDENFNGEHDAGEPSGSMCVAASLSIGRGVLLAFSDSSLFLNGMLGFEDNSRLLEALVSGRSPYVLRDTLPTGVYANVRELALESYNTVYSIVFYSSLSYPIAFLSALSAYVAAVRLHPRLGARRRFSLNDKIYNALKLHPMWDRRVLEEMASEVFD